MRRVRFDRTRNAITRESQSTNVMEDCRLPLCNTRPYAIINAKCVATAHYSNHSLEKKQYTRMSKIY